MWRTELRRAGRKVGHSLLQAISSYSKEGFEVEKPSKKHIKLLIFALAVMLLLSVGVNLFVHYTAFGSFGSMRSGEFTNTSQGVNRNGWHFYADAANGNSTFFAYLNQTDLDSLTLESSIESGGAVLVIFQDNVRLTYILGGEESATTVDTDLLVPGRIEMRLYLTYAENIRARMNWRETN